MRLTLLLVSFVAACGGGPQLDGGSPGKDGGSSFASGDMLGGGHDLGAGTDLSTGNDLAQASGPMVGLTFTGCAPDFSGKLVALSGSGSMVVANAASPASGEVQLHLVETSGTIVLSSLERESTGDVVNLLAGTTYTNDQTSEGNDPISGTITIHSYDEAAAQADLTFTAVMLQNVEDHSICQVDGELVSSGSSF